MEFFIGPFIIGHAVVHRKAAGPGHGTYAAQFHGVVHGKGAYPLQPALDGIVIKEDDGHLVDFLLQFLHFGQDFFPHGVRNIPPDTADFADRENDPAPGGGFEDIQHDFPDPPGVHEEALKSHGVRRQPAPEEVAVHAGQFMPHGAQIAGPFRDFYIHESFHRLGVAPAMAEGADAAHPLRHVDELLEVPLFHQFSSPRCT